MALHLSTLYSAADPDGRRLEFHCYAAPYYHHVVVPFDATHASEGWARRGGKPICPGHCLPGDEPYQEDSMTMIRHHDDVTKLIGEMRWWGDDPDLQRIADAIPLAYLERAYVKKLDALDPALIQTTPTGRAASTSSKLSVLRRIYAAWLRAADVPLGKLLSLSLWNVKGNSEASNFSDDDIASACEKRYPPKK